MLVTVGTAICGGSAIAAVAPVIRAKNHDVSVALATVFFLNAVALFIFPPIGHHFGLGQRQFGVWSALAIHDTSSVVGAAMQYGARALEIATTIKLTRALWIVPVTLIIGMLWNRGTEAKGKGKAKRPWFILGFLAAAAIVTLIPVLKPAGHDVFVGAQRSLVVTLFLIGSGLSREALQRSRPATIDPGLSALGDDGQRHTRRDPARLDRLIRGEARTAGAKHDEDLTPYLKCPFLRIRAPYGDG